MRNLRLLNRKPMFNKKNSTGLLSFIAAIQAQSRGINVLLLNPKSISQIIKVEHLTGYYTVFDKKTNRPIAAVIDTVISIEDLLSFEIDVVDKCAESHE